jgi:photosystem II stability/assembly factor-like uncharacterized protein
MSWKWRLAIIAGSVIVPMVAVGCGTRAYDTTATGSQLASLATGHLSGPAGSAGSAVWALNRGGVVLSQADGAAWSELRFPAGVSARSVAAVAATPGREVWVAEAVPSGVELLHHSTAGAAGWSATKLISPSAPAAAPERVDISAGNGATVTVLEVWDQSISLSVARVFVSPDDGLSFRQLPAPDRALPYLGLRWWSASFASAADGVAVVGATGGYVLRTTNGGQSWSRSRLIGVPANQEVALGQPVLDGTSIELPVFTASPASTGDETFALYASRDGGAAFTRSSRPVTVTGSTVPGVVPMAVRGNTIWLLPSPGSQLLRSDNDGATWSRVDLPFNQAQAISAATASSATIVAGGSLTCHGQKSHGVCSQQPVAIWKTTDDGRAWQNVSPGSAAS